MQIQRIVRHLVNCHTPALGGIQYQCDHCHGLVPLYHSCRDRHCPQCQGRASRRWSEHQQQDILPVTYYHLIFTLPHELNSWLQLHPEVLYNLLFQVVLYTLKTFGADPKRLGGKLGMTAVLHTWGQNLSQHVHLHCLKAQSKQRDAIPYIIECACPMGGLVQQTFICHAAHSR